MVTFTCSNLNPQYAEGVDCASILHASQAIQRNWTPEEKLKRAALANKQTLKLIELVFGS